MDGIADLYMHCFCFELVQYPTSFEMADSKSLPSSLFFAAFFIAAVQARTYRIPSYLTCPGINDTDADAKPQVRIGVMFDFPLLPNETQVYEEAGLEPGDVLPGKLLIPYSPLAVSAYKQAVKINANPAILPYHHLCLYFTFTPVDFLDIRLGSNYIFVHSRVRQVVNALYDMKQHLSHAELMVHYSPLITIGHSLSTNICPDASLSTLLKAFLGVQLKYDSSCTSEVRDTQLSMAAPHLSLYSAGYSFVQRMGWKKFGLITTCDCFLRFFTTSDEVQLGHYVPTRFIEMFKMSGFEEHEINIYIFLGPMVDFFRLLVEAYDNGFSGSLRTFVWIVLTFHPNITESEVFKQHSFSPQDKVKIRHMLVGAIAIQPFDNCSTGLIRSGVITDAITVHSLAAMSCLEEKAANSGVNITDVILERDDYDDITRHLFNTTLNGITGILTFDRYCNRVANTFVITNFVPQSNATLPYRKERKGFVVICQTEVMIEFIDSSTGLKSDVSTIVFHNGLMVIPSDSISKFYTRNNRVIVGCLILELVLYLVMSLLYLTYVNKVDKRANVYNESWIYHDNDISYSIDQSGVNIMLSWLTYNGDQTIGQINNAGNAVYIHKAKLNMSQLNVKMRQKILTILDFKHDNICPFVGGILQGSLITGLMYEYCTRGSLYDLLTNPHIGFNKSFRQSFAIDCSEGLAYLHGRKAIHGRLTSKNCVIDQHWNLKLTDYEPIDIHYTKVKRLSKLKTAAKKIYYLPDQDTVSDIYNFGVILTELCCRETLLKFGSINFGKIHYDEDVGDRYVELIEKCHQMKKSARPSASFIKGYLKDCLSFYTFHFKNDTAAAEMYSKNLERHILELNTSIQDEKNANGDILANHIPKPAINAIQNKIPLKMKLAPNTVILCFGLCDIDGILSTYTKEQVSKIIVIVDRLLDGIATSFNMHRIQSFGSTWTYISYQYEEETADKPGVQEVFNCAVKLLLLFKERQSTQKLSVRMSIHLGDLICGVVNETIPFHAAVGTSIDDATQLMIQCPVNAVLISERAKNDLPNRMGLKKFDKKNEDVVAYIVTAEDCVAMSEDQEKFDSVANPLDKI